MIEKTRVIFTTKRLCVGKFGPQDWRELQRFGGLENVARMMGSLQSPWPKSAVKSWIDASIYQGRTGFRAGIYLEGDLIEFLGIGGTGAAGGGPSIGYALAPEFQGRGFMHEAVLGLLAFSFETLNVSVIEADAFVDNAASNALLNKIGFEIVAQGLSESLARLEPAPNLLYRLSRTQWKAARYEVS